MMEQNNLKIITNPIVNQSLCTMRNKNTDTEGVRLQESSQEYYYMRRQKIFLKKILK